MYMLTELLLFMTSTLYNVILHTQVQCCLSASYSNSGSSCPHLQCLTVLKKLCNCPSLIYHESNELDEAKVKFQLMFQHINNKIMKCCLTYSLGPFAWWFTVHISS